MKFIFLIPLLFASMVCADAEPEAEKAKRMEMTEAALHGDAQTAYELARWYLFRREYSLARQWYQEAAKKNLIPAIWELAELINQNWGNIGRDMEQIKACGLQLLKLKDIRGYRMLAEVYVDKSSSLYNLPMAMLNYKEGALAGDFRCATRLAIIHYQGIAVDNPDFSSAYQWFSVAAEAGDPEALRWLGLMLRDGLGVVAEKDEGWKMLMRAANLGDGESAYEIGYGYEMGQDLPKNLGLAVEYYEKARAKGYTQAILRLAKLDKP